MRLEAIKQLHNGDEVLWTDPDNDQCSKHITILELSVEGDVVRIWSVDGGYLEAFAEELS
jgi:hypothetical protein